MNAMRFPHLPTFRTALCALSAAGAAWLALWAPAAAPAQTSRPPLVVTLDDNYPPYVFRDADGNLKGILPDQWALWTRKTGVPVDLQAMEWSKAQQFMREGKADVIDTVFLTDERKQLYDFTPPYARITVPVYAHKSLGGIADVSSLKGFNVGVKAGDAVIGHLASRGIETVEEFPSYEAIVQAAKNQELKVFSVDEPAALYFMYKYGVADEFRQSFVLYTGEFHRAVRKNRPDLLQLVQTGFGRISGREYRDIERKWMGAPFLLREIVRQWGPYLLLVLAAVLALGALNAVLSFRVRAQTAELRESREYLATVFDSINDALFIHDAQTFRVVDVNRRMLEMYGYDTRAEALEAFNRMSGGEPPFSMDDAVRWMTLAREEGPQIFEWRSFHRDGHPFWVEIAIRRVRFRTADRLLVVAREISDRKKAEEDRREMERRTLEAQKLESLGLLAGGIAHDFNNLLAAIMGNLDLALLALPADSPARDDLVAAGVSTKQAAELVQQMLAFSGQSRFTIEPLDVGAMLHRVLQMARTTLPAHAQIQLRIPAALPAIEADETQVRQVVMNLIANAAEALENRPGTIDLAAGTYAANQVPAAPLWPHAPLAAAQYVYVEVSDPGTGIPADQLGKIFEPFFSTKFTGRGLGLPAVLGIVRGHKGAIQVHSVPGQGSTFRVLFPAKA
jgi:PAS domain S-box-containing protein